MEFRVVELNSNRVVIQHDDDKYYEMAIIASVNEVTENTETITLVNDIRTDTRFVGHGSIEFFRDWLYNQYAGILVFDISEIDSVYSTIWRSKLSELGFTDDGNDRWSQQRSL